MYISTAMLFFAILIIIYYACKYSKYHKLALYMSCVPKERESLELSLQNYSSNPENINRAFSFLFPKYIDYMASLYMNVGVHKDNNQQYLYSLVNLDNSSSFVKVTFFNFIRTYMSDNIKNLTTYKDEIRYGSELNWTEIREKGKLYKQFEELQICSAKECMKIKKIHKHLIINIELLEKHALEDTVNVYH